MTTLLTFRDNVKGFYSRYDYIFTPIVKFIVGLLVFSSLAKQMGYMAALNSTMVKVAMALLCACLPIEVLAGIGGVFVVLHSAKVSLDVGLVGLAFVLIFYCGFMRFSPKTGVLVFLVPIFYSLHLIYVLPVVVGFLVGPAAIIPVAFGVLFYYYELGLADLTNVLAATTEEENAVQGYQYILNALIENKQMLLVMVVFACVILIVFAIYKLPFSYSWIAAFIVGGFLNVALFMLGGISMNLEVEISSVVVGSVVGVVVSLVIQFVKGIVDYQRTELLQFEDDDYYYYVKAIPKLSVTETNKNVKRINTKTRS